MNAKETIGKYIPQIHRYTQIYIDKILKKYQLSSGSFPFLAALYQRDNVNQEYLANHLNINKATTARAIRELVKTVYVTVSKDETDSRANITKLTVMDKNFQHEIREKLLQWTDILSSGFSKAEYELIINLLKRIGENAYKYKTRGKNG